MPPKHRTAKHKHKPKASKTNKMHIVKGMGKYSSGKVKGRGGYAEDMGGKIGGWLGTKAGGLLSSIFGLGSYSVNKNSLTKQGAHASANDPPLVTNTSGGTRIQHREYIKDISGSELFVLEAFPVNPGLSGTFPWLAGVASAFEEYRLHGILFEFKSTSATALNSTNTALGTVIMATEYNPLHNNFASKREMENHVYSTPCKPSESALHPLECARDVTVLDELFIRNVPIVGADLRFSDIGKFQIATVGMQAAAVIGELWVTYDVELLKPKLPDSVVSVAAAHYAYSASLGVGGSAPTSANLFGTSVQKMALTGTGVSPVSLSTNTITFSATGRYICYVNLSGDSTVLTFPSYTYGASCTTSALWHATGLNALTLAPSNGATSSSQIFGFGVNVLDTVTPTVVISAGTIPANIVGADLFIFPVPTGFSDPPKQLTPVEEILEAIRCLNHRIDRLDTNVGLDEFDEKSPSEGPVLIRSEDQEVHALSGSTIDLVKLLKSRLG